MESLPPLPQEKTVLLSAGPRAGKTTLLLKWRDESAAPTQYLALTPEDAEPSFFRYRLLKEWPELKARYAQLAADSLSRSWGALLGMAIAETHPDFCLLLDDFHHLEDAALSQQLQALFRHFPLSGTLVLASRHQAPAIEGRSTAIWGADLPMWHESPEGTDLQRLPSDHFERMLTLALVGEASPSPEGMELVRRNIARITPPSVLQLRSSWRKAAEEVLAAAIVPDTVWEEVERELRAFHHRHLRTSREREVSAILARIPSDIRKRRPAFLQLEGDLLFEESKNEEARGCYLQALEQGGLLPEVRLDLTIGLAKTAFRMGDTLAFGDHTAQLQESIGTASNLQRGRFLVLRALSLWLSCDHDQAQATLSAVLALPASGDRALLYEHCMALYHLSVLNMNRSLGSEAKRYAEQAIAIATDQHFQKDLLLLYAAQLKSNMLLDAGPASLEAFVEIPNEAFAHATPIAFHQYLFVLAHRVRQLKEFELARRYFNHIKATAQAHNLVPYYLEINQGLLDVSCQLNQVENARIVYEETLQALAPFPDLRLFAQRVWAITLANAGQSPEAEALLKEELARPLTSLSYEKTMLALFYVRHQGGDTTALDEARALLETPNGSKLWDNEAYLLEKLGLRTLPAVFHLHAFGPLSFSLAGQRDPLRRKVLMLLAHVMLNPEGIKAKPLAEKLFGDPTALEALHTVAYNLRQIFKAAGAGTLFESDGGLYRLKWKEIAFCDLREFDAFYRKARSLEAQGFLEAAASFYELALLQAPAPLFENLLDSFQDERQAHAEQVHYAQEFVKKRKGRSRM